MRRAPSTAELAAFVRGNLPPVLRLVELKNDPPVPLPDAAPGDNAWLYNVRLTFAPVEDELGPPPPQEVKAFQTVVDELNNLAAWSEAYTQSPYARMYPGFIVEPPTPAAPTLLAVIHAKDRPRAPLYAKMAAEWQVDHWHFSVQNLRMPAAGGQFRSAYSGPVFIQGEAATEQFLATTRATLAQAKEKKEVVEAAYQEDLLKATRPGMVYRGQISLDSVAVPAEVRFVEPPVADTRQARFEVRLPGTPGHLFVYSARLAGRLPVQPAAVAGNGAAGNAHEEAEQLPKADLTVGLERAVGKEVAANTLANQMLIALTHYEPPRSLLLNVHRGHLEGRLTTGAFQLEAQQAP